MDDNFYHALEEAFRGPEDVIRGRLGIYLPILRALHEDGLDGDIIDLGCGRGEWLSVVANHLTSLGADTHLTPTGVDISRLEVDRCKENGLNAVCIDAVTFVNEQESGTVPLITAFHIAEHLGTEPLLTLLSACCGALKPGGAMIVETPNPENLLVGSCNFYLDPSHKHPLPPLLLQFMMKRAGFQDCSIIRLPHQGAPDIGNDPVDAWHLLTGTSQDYAVIGFKQEPSAAAAAALSQILSYSAPMLPEIVQAMRSEAASPPKSRAADATADGPAGEASPIRELKDLSTLVAKVTEQVGAVAAQSEVSVRMHAEQIDSINENLKQQSTASQSLMQIVTNQDATILKLTEIETSRSGVQDLSKLIAKVTEQVGAIAIQSKASIRLHESQFERIDHNLAMQSAAAQSLKKIAKNQNAIAKLIDAEASGAALAKELAAAIDRATVLEGELEQQAAELQNARVAWADADRAYRWKEFQVKAIYSSASWKLTAPVRRIAELSKGVVRVGRLAVHRIFSR